MDLGSFLADESIGGSWADEDVDMSSIGIPKTGSTGNSSSTPAYQRREEFQQGFSGGFDDRPKREEFPVPDAPPYRARVGNLPYDVNESLLSRYFEDRLQAQGCVSDIKVPVDTMSGRPKGFAFVTFTERDILEESLNLTLSEFNGRKIFVNVAAPQKQDVFDMDWRASGRGMQSSNGRGDRGDRGDRPRRTEAEIDWSVRGTGLPPRERSDRGEGRGEGRPPRREEADLDWGVARSTTTTLPPRERSNRDGERSEKFERKPRREEPDLDWGVARSTTTTLPPRERSNRTERPDRPEGSDSFERKPKREEPDLDWGVARSTTVALPPKEKKYERPQRTERPKKVEEDFDWKRDQPIEVRHKNKSNHNNSNAKSKNTKPQQEKEKAQGPQKSVFDVLNIEGESDDEEEEVKEDKTETQPSTQTGLEEATSKLNVEDSKDGGDWEVVGK